MAGRATRTRKPEQQLKHQRSFFVLPVFRSATRKSFTLIELLMVVLVIMILCGIIIGSAGYVNRKAAEAKTSALLAKISTAIESYKADWGIYPLSDVGAAQNWDRRNAQNNYNAWLMTNLGGLNGKKYLDWAPDETNSFAVSATANATYIIDGFGMPICYFPSINRDFHSTVPRGQFVNDMSGVNTNIVNFTSYDLWSLGGDSQSKDATTAADDIKNW